MKNTTHTPAPWWAEHGIAYGSDIIGENGLWLGYFITAETGRYECEANADHAIKCVNDHKGMLSEMKSLAKALEDTGHEPPQSFYDAIAQTEGRS